MNFVHGFMSVLNSAELGGFVACLILCVIGATFVMFVVPKIILLLGLE